MEHDFDQDYWDEHWRQTPGQSTAPQEVAPNPYLLREVADLAIGTALEAGSGESAEAIWLAAAGWRVTAVDIAAEALDRATGSAAAQGLSRTAIQWVRADLSSWEPSTTFDLVTTHYAHPAMPQLAFYDRLAAWVAPGGSLLIVGHLHTEDGGHGGHGADHPPAEASVTAASITQRLDPTAWAVVTAEELTRTLDAPGGEPVTLHDVVVRAVRLSTYGGDRPAGSWPSPR
jgi:2-polyprenyl-3-methyl-5-hydroxy-6-metoxy-1,4-benzoquinol methylase